MRRCAGLEFIDNLKKGGLYIIGDTVTVPEVQAGSESHLACGTSAGCCGCASG